MRPSRPLVVQRDGDRDVLDGDAPLHHLDAGDRLDQLGEHRGQLHEHVAAAGGQVGQRGADAAVVVDADALPPCPRATSSVGDRLGWCCPAARRSSGPSRSSMDLTYGEPDWCRRRATDPEMRYGGTNLAFFSRSGRDRRARRRRSRSAGVQGVEDAVEVGSVVRDEFDAHAERRRRSRLIRSMSSPPSSGMPLNGGSGRPHRPSVSPRAHRSCSSAVRAWSIWSYAYVAIAAVVIASPLRASDS